MQRGGSPVRLHKGKSLDSLTMQLDYKPWYDRSRIRESVSRESIADFGAAKSRFEYTLTPTKSEFIE
uniref:Uncharacterized protein n=2 Tax=Ascarididae TaxID=6250 RepID=A0A914RLC3_PAREQ